MEGRETPGFTTRLIIEHVRRRAGEAGVLAVIRRAGVGHDASALVDEARWFTHAEKLALLDAAAAELDDPEVGLHIGQRAGDGPGRARPVLRALGSPGAVLSLLSQQATIFTTVAEIDAVEIRDLDAVIRYRVTGDHRPSRHDCGFMMGLLRVVSQIFDLPPAEVTQRACQVDGDDACVYAVRWTAMPRSRRFLGRRTRREHVRGLTAKFWELESATFDLVNEGDPETVLRTIAARAADAIGASGHVLALTDVDGEDATVIEHGVVGGGGALLDAALNGLVDDDDPHRIVAELSSPRRRYGHLVVTFDDGREPLPEERTILRAHARNAAIALDAASAIASARLREETASMLLRLARSLADLTTVDDVAIRVSEALPPIVGADQSGVFLVDDDDPRTLRARGWAGLAPAAAEDVAHLRVSIEEAVPHLPPEVAHELVLVDRSTATGPIAELMDEHGETFAAFAPILVRGSFRGVICCGWREAASVGPAALLDERMSAVADQAASAIESALLLEQVRHQALHDALTDLPNQTLFADRVESEIRRGRRNGGRVAVGVLDLDRFKTVNDSLGHTAGDQLLVQVSERIARAIRAPDTVARMGGDEFTLLLPDVEEGGERLVAERILEAFVQPFVVDGHRLRISPSIGLATYPDDGDTFEQLLRCADVAMYRAKDRGRNTWAVYASGMAERAYDRLTLENDLYRALQRRELRVLYQPLVRLADGEVVGTEALVRWAHPSLGLLLPEEFLPIAEDLGLMAEIDGWVLRQACLELGATCSAGARLDHVTVNISARTICHPALERLVTDALSAGGLDPKRLVLEVTEADTVDPVSIVSDALHRLRTQGVRVSLDDFGRGRSALSRLEHLPIDRIKVDAGFLAGVVDPDTPAPVAEAIVAMGHGLGVEVCAEGVETEAQRAFAKRIGFDLVQGWFVGRPGTELDYAGARSRTASRGSTPNGITARAAVVTPLSK